MDPKVSQPKKRKAAAKAEACLKEQILEDELQEVDDGSYENALEKRPAKRTATAKTKRITPRTTRSRVVKKIKKEATSPSAEFISGPMMDIKEAATSQPVELQSEVTERVENEAAHIPAKARPAVRVSRTARKTKSTTIVKKETAKVGDIVLDAFDGETELDHDPQLLSLVKRMIERAPLEQKPLPIGEPEVWATGRQELCETLPYYQSYHGGCYMNSGTVYSFMLDGISQAREFIGEDVIICRAGGSMEADGNAMAQAKDQTLSDTQPLAVLNNIRHQTPVVVICGDRNTALPTRMPHKFCVLGWFKPTHIWCEKIKGSGLRTFTSVRYRLERVNARARPWYAGPAEVRTTQDTFELKAMKIQRCHICSKEFLEIFLCGWMCLNGDCRMFWLLAGGKNPPSDAVIYHPATLTGQVPWANEREMPFRLNPGLPRSTCTYSYANSRGVVCPQCGRCNQRYLFTGWQCGSCDWSLHANFSTCLPTQLQDASWQISRPESSSSQSNCKPVVQLQIQHIHGYKVCRYTIPGVRGCIFHAKVMDQAVIQEPQGPDEMFQALQTEDVGLVRREFRPTVDREKLEHQSQAAALPLTLAQADEAIATLRDHTSGSFGTLDQDSQQLDDSASTVSDLSDPPDLCQQYLESADFVTNAEMTAVNSNGRMQSFSVNYGMPYKFTGSGESRSFAEASWTITAGRSRLNWAVKAFAGLADNEFNELLLIAYMERQKISYHDDGEAGLGATIASLSLGSNATMSLRLKAKHFSGVSKQGLLTFAEPLPLEVLRACSTAKKRSPAELQSEEKQYYRRRKAYQELLAAKNDPSTSVRINDLSKSLAMQLGLKHSSAQSMLDLHLGHGDIVIMQGEALQRFFEHAVTPHGDLRFAMTCRHIQPEHLAAHERPSYAVHPDSYGYDGSRVAATSAGHDDGAGAQH